MRYLSSCVFLVLFCIPALAEVPPAQNDTVTITHRDTVFVVQVVQAPRTHSGRSKAGDYAFTGLMEGIAVGAATWIIWRAAHNRDFWKADPEYEDGATVRENALLTIGLPAAGGALLGAIIGLGEHYPAPISFMPLHNGGMVLLAMAW